MSPTFHNRDKTFKNKLEQFHYEYTQAKKKEDKHTREVLSLLLNTAKNKAKIENRDITEEDIIEAAIKQEKECLESLKSVEGRHLSNKQEIFREAWLQELVIIQEYLPPFLPDISYFSLIKKYLQLENKPDKKQIIQMFKEYLKTNNVRADMRKFVSLLDEELKTKKENT